LFGWSLAELKSRVLIASEIANNAYKDTSAQSTTSATSNASSLSVSELSQWRALFSSIVFLHDKHFPGSSTIGTAYDSLGAPWLDLLPFLFPHQFDYANVGILHNENHLEYFHLYDVTRRALNCLTLLFTDPETTFTPAIFHQVRREIVESIFTSTNQAPQTQNSIAQQNYPDVPQSANGTDDGKLSEPSQADLNKATRLLVNLVTSCLEAWNGYLRENYSVNSDLQNNETGLLAYQAGYSFASLPWTISLLSIPLEDALEALDLNTEPAVSGMTKLYQTWKKVFDEGTINQLQNQISALSLELDDTYRRLNKDIQSKGTDDTQLDPDLPSQTIEAVKHSLDYWQETITWLGSERAQLSFCNAHTLLTKPKEPILPQKSARRLRVALGQQALIWQSLLLRRQSLRAFSDESVTTRMLSDLQEYFEAAIHTNVLNALEKTVKESDRKRKRSMFLTIAMIILLLLFVTALLLPLPAQYKAFLSLIPAAATVALGLFDKLADYLNKIGITTSDRSKQGTDEMTPDQRFSNFFGLDKSEISSTFKSGYENLLIRFNYLNYSISVCQPLIKFFTNPDDLGILFLDGWDFLTNIAWTNSEGGKIITLTRNAFGSLGTFIGAQLHL
jgi:hypothetical protein